MPNNWIFYLLGLANYLNIILAPIFMLFLMGTVTIGIILMACGMLGSNKEKDDRP